MPRPVIWTDPALDDLAAIRTYIDAMNPPAARRVAQRIVEAADTLETFPLRGRASRGARVLVAVLPYLIRY
ncbi:MAG TPA: type II toxin-antitoxin system RelE/ParE family toxin [Caulobacteraceae bacterium]|nr:type II toxin-antitoxin system RelE/ParE family toxin [Caulobacteraceae bacterium]